MLGRFYNKWGSKESILHRIGDNRGNPNVGPIQVTLTESNRLVVLGKNKVISVHQFVGVVEYRICPISEKDKLSRYFVEKAYELQDEEENWRERYLSNQDEIEEENRIPKFYLDIMPVAIAGHIEVPLLAMLDDRNCIKIINLDTKEVVTTFGRMGVNPGEMSKPTAIHLFRIGRMTLIALGDSGVNQRITIFDASGNCLLSVGGPGLTSGKFRDINSIATFLPMRTKGPVMSKGQQKKDIYDEAFLPDWYKGQEYDEEELVDCLFEKHLSSNFVVGQSSVTPTYYWIYYITASQTIQKLYLVYHGDNYGPDGFTVSQHPPNPITVRLAASDPTIKRYQTILEVIHAHKPALQQRKDFRASCLLAVSDERNFRIQIFRYYWTQSFLYHPEIKYVTCIGGMKHQYLPLTRPVHVAYDPIGGELSICDGSSGNIFLLSTNYLLIKTIHVDYFSAFDVECSQCELIQQSASSSSTPQTEVVNIPHVQYLRKAQQVRANNPIVRRNDHRKPCVSLFTTAGHMIVGYQSGGIYIFQSNGQSSLGRLSMLEVPLFEKIVTEYLTYPDIEQLRNSCRFLHHFTRDLRCAYKFFPVERHKILNKVIYLFLKWARVGQDGTQKIQMAFPTRVQNIATINPDEAEALHKQTQGTRKGGKGKLLWDEEPMSMMVVKPKAPPPGASQKLALTRSSAGGIGGGGNALIPTTATNTPTTPKASSYAIHYSQYQAKMEKTEQAFQQGVQLEQRLANDPAFLTNNPLERRVILRDRFYHPICKYHMQLLCPLAADRCGDSHLPVVYERKDMQETQGYLLYDDFYCFLSELFDVKYIWKYEQYILELFQFYAYEQDLWIRKDPMSRKNEVIRPTVLMKTKTLSFLGYLEIILLLEENLHGYKSIVDHKLFSEKGRQRHVPRKAAAIKMEGWKDHPTLIADPTQQYEPPNIPFPPLKSLIGKKTLTKPGMENVTRFNDDPIQEHLEIFQFQAAKASEFINKLFS